MCDLPESGGGRNGDLGEWVAGLARWIEESLLWDLARQGRILGVPLVSGSMPLTTVLWDDLG